MTDRSKQDLSSAMTGLSVISSISFSVTLFGVICVIWVTILITDIVGKDNPNQGAIKQILEQSPTQELLKHDGEDETNTESLESTTLSMQDSTADNLIETTSSEQSITTKASEDGEESGQTFKKQDEKIYYGESADLKYVPGWVWLYPGSIEAKSNFHSVSTNDVSGALTIMTKDKVKSVQNYYKNKFEGEGYMIGTEIITQTGDGIYGAISGKLKTEGREISVVAVEQGGVNQVTINYNEKKQ